MSTPFYSNEAEVIQRQISNEDKTLLDSGSVNAKIDLEMDRCVKWVKDHNYTKVALQFPDNLVCTAVDIAKELSAKTRKQTFVLADTSYGSCCVDEITAEHVTADAIIHYGHACLSLTQRFPVLYIFGKWHLDVPHVVSSFKECFPDINSSVIIYYEVTYYHAIGDIVEKLKEYKNLVTSEILFPNEECKAIVNDNQVKVTKNQRYFIFPKTRDFKDYAIFYIGCRTETLTNVMLCLNKCKFYLYNTVNRTVRDDTFNKNRFLRKRFFYIEKARDAKIIGILVGTLGVSNYISTIKRLREAIAAAKKKSYVIVIGKRNVAKMANFIEIEVYVNVACFESTVVDCSGFFQPIITPYELEIALNVREWTEDYVTDFTELLPDGGHYVPLSEIQLKNDVSLITGKARCLDCCSDTSDESTDESSAIVQRDEMVISEIHQQAAGEFLTQRSWKGLEQNLGQTPAADIQMGKKGIAAEYDNEGEAEN